MATPAVIQILVFFGLTGLVALLTWRHCRNATRATSDTKEYFLANSGLNWVLIAGSITLTNINTDTMVGWNGNQMLLITWWELSAVVGLLLLAKVFVPIYYKYKCTTVTELLERRYHDKNIRVTVATIFLLGNAIVDPTSRWPTLAVLGIILVGIPVYYGTVGKVRKS